MSESNFIKRCYDAGPMKVLGIETSCDETGIALYDSDAGIVADALYSQIKLHQQYGGVVPELASRDHIRKTLPLIREVLAKADCSGKQLDGIAYTAGPGLSGALLVGGRDRPLAWHDLEHSGRLACITWKATCSRRCSNRMRRSFPSSRCSCPVATRS